MILWSYKIILLNDSTVGYHKLGHNKMSGDKVAKVWKSRSSLELKSRKSEHLVPALKYRCDFESLEQNNQTIVNKSSRSYIQLKRFLTTYLELFQQKRGFDFAATKQNENKDFQNGSMHKFKKSANLGLGGSDITISNVCLHRLGLCRQKIATDLLGHKNLKQKF